MTIPETIGRTEITRLIDEWIIGMDAERDREILAYRLIDGLTYEQIADRFQAKHPERPVSIETIKRALKKREPQIFRHFPR